MHIAVIARRTKVSLTYNMSVLDHKLRTAGNITKDQICYSTTTSKSGYARISSNLSIVQL